MNISDISNAFWLNEEHTALQCDYDLPGFGIVPLTVEENDGGDLSTEVWNIRDQLQIAEYEDRDKTRENQEEIEYIRQLITNTDYKAIKYAEGLISEEEYSATRTLRQSYRNRINEIENPTPDLDDLKEQKHNELRTQRDQLRQTEFAEFDNDTFQIRQEDQDNMNTFYTHAVAMLSGVVQREIFGLMSATNTLHYFDPEEIVELAQIMKLKVQEIYQRYWYARDVLLENASTESEIQSVQIPLTIPNLQE